MKNMQQIMKQAQKMQEQLQKQMAEMSVEGSSGGGMVSIKMNGLKQVLGVKIEPDAATSGDVEMLQDLIIAAFNEAARKVDEELSGQIGNLTGGIKIPGLF
jgi:nucleoid-associated protein EbfC